MRASIVIPAFNASKTIMPCLNSLAKQCGDDCEIIVVDDGSTDNTAEVAASYPGVRVLRQKNAGPAVARNEGARTAKGDLLLFTDSDCEPMDNWFKEMVRPFEEDPSIAGVKGVYRTRQKALSARFVQYEYEDKYDKMAKCRYIDFIDTYSAGFKRNIFIEMGGYDSSFPVACAEDIELSYRMHSRDYKMVFNPGAIVYHIHPSSFWSYLKKKYKFAYWRMLAIKKNPSKAVSDSHTPQLMKFQMLLSPLLIGAALASAFTSLNGGFLALAISLFMATTLPFMVKTFRKDRAVGIICPVFFFSRGLSQFMGVINGGIRQIRSK